MRVTGPVAQFGRGVMQDVSAKLMGQFADCLAEKMTAGEPAAAAAAGAEPAAVPAGAPPPGPAGESAEAAARAPESRPEAEALDLGAAGREAVLKRAAPVLVALAVLIVVLRIVGRRR
jgi:uncharacterized protein